MENEELESLFKNLEGTFDIEEPTQGHQQRFLEKLAQSKGTVSLSTKKTSWWKPLAVAASVVLLVTLGFNQMNKTADVSNTIAEIAPEVANTEYYFASLIEEQVKELEKESTPETKRIVEDTMVQLKQLETSYKSLEQELVNGGNSKLILSAMITNFQTRISLLQDVLDQIETIKNIKAYSNEESTI